MRTIVSLLLALFVTHAAAQTQNPPASIVYSRISGVPTAKLLGRSTASTGAAEALTAGSGVITALGTNTGSAGAFVVNGGALGTPSSGTLTNASGLPVSGISGLGTGVITALGTNTGSAGAFVVNGGALGTPSSGTLTSATGLPVSTGISGLGTGVATFLGTPSWTNFNTALTGRVYFRANNSGASQTNIPDSSFTKINFGTEVVDSGSAYDPSTSTWTPPANCLALITSAVLVQGTFSNGDIYLAIYKNGSAYKGVNTKTSVATSMQVTGIDVANGTDAYTIYVYTDTSTGTGTANQSAVYSTFSGLCL